MAPQSLTATMQAIQQKAHPLLWDPVMVRVLLLPAWGLVGTLGIIFGMLGRRKRRINIYHN